MDYLHHNIVNLVSAMRRSDATYAFVDYNLYKYMTVPGTVRVHWKHDATLLVTSIDEAIEPVPLLVLDWAAPIPVDQMRLQESTLPFTASVLAIFDQVRILRYRSGAGQYDGGGGAFHVTAKGLAFLDYDPRCRGADLHRIWSHQI